MSTVDPNLVAVVAWAGQLFQVYGGAIILNSALIVIAYFYHAKTEKKLKQNNVTLELLTSNKANVDARIGIIEKTVEELARRADGLKTINEEAQTEP